MPKFTTCLFLFIYFSYSLYSPYYATLYAKQCTFQNRNLRACFPFFISEVLFISLYGQGTANYAIYRKHSVHPRSQFQIGPYVIVQ